MVSCNRIDFRTIQLVIVGACAISSIVVSQFALPFAIIAISAVVIDRLFIQKRVVATPVDLSLLFFSFGVLANPLLSVRPSVSLPLAMQTITGVMLLVGLSDWVNRTVIRLRWATIGLAFIGLALVVIAPFTVDWITDKFGPIPSGLYSSFSSLSRRTTHPNILAGAIAVLLVTLTPYVFWMWANLRNWERMLFLLSLLSMGLMLVMTQSRGGMIGVAFGLVVMVLIALPRQWRIIVAVVILLGLFTLSAIMQINPDSLVDSSVGVRGASGRLEIWSNAYMIVSDFPYTGIGFGNFSAVADLFYSFLLAGEGQPHAHNLFLQIAVDTGLISLIAWLACLIVVLVCCIQTLGATKGSRNPLLIGVAVGLLCGQLTMLAHGISDAPLWATRPALLVWVLWGMALALPGLTKQRSESMAAPAQR